MMIKVSSTRHFDKLVKALRKKYPNVLKDLETLVDQLKAGQLPGDRLQRIDDYEAYKVRVANRDALRGKSGGYRVIYYVRTATAVYMIQIYFKSDVEDISEAEIIAEIEAALSESETEEHDDDAAGDA